MDEEKQRYSRIKDLLNLILFISVQPNGVTIKDIQEKFSVSRRTAERMRDCLAEISMPLVEIATFGQTKRWGFCNMPLDARAITFTPNEMATLKKIKNTCSDEISQKDIESIINKIKAMKKAKRLYMPKIEDEIDFIMRSECYAVKQMSDYKLNINDFSIIRDAIKRNFKIKANYKDKERILLPLGLLYDEKVYLIAREEGAKEPDLEKTFILYKLKNVELYREHFDTKDFDIKTFAERSFGVYQGEVYDVKLRFDKEIAEDILNYKFHPTQRKRLNPDGSVSVSFKASGAHHIFWNLFRWGAKAKIVAPVELKQKYKEYLEDVLTNM